ncbi:FAD-binding oxidoreductase [Streptosporangium sp. NPDC051022]|uniref:FAD-binding oxidoreductase n=1 Tax=Streptosporangium sp. NPDC051022 TaxID=3155752 RepID=UPI00343E6F72
MTDLQALVADLGDVPYLDDAKRVRPKSRDRFAQSPILRELLKDKYAEIVISPRDKDELRIAVAACARHRVPITVRGGGTGNFGQGVPLNGGAILDVTGLAGVLWHRDGKVRARAGTVIADIDDVTREDGWELRVHPSTKRTATIGGFLAGGHAGIGSVQYGIMRDRGNISAIEIMTVEEEPRLIELRGADVNIVHHAYGSNGVITEVELPLAHAWTWNEIVVMFADFGDASRFAVKLASSDGLLKKVVSLHAWPLPSYFRPLAPYVRDGHAMVMAMVAQECMEPLRDLVAECGGEITGEAPEGRGDYGCPIYEFTWGHAGTHYQRHDRTLTGLIGLFPPGDLLGAIDRVHENLGDVGHLNMEFKRFDGMLSSQGSPEFPFQGEDHMAEVVKRLEAEGCRVANSHTYLLGAGGMKPIGEREIAFKRDVDPYGLLNQGKVDYGDGVAEDAPSLPIAGWSYERTG